MSKEPKIDLNDDDFGAVLNCAVRYAIGRQTYMPGLVIGYITPLLPYLNNRTLWCFDQDIADAKYTKGYGDPIIDEPVWMRFHQAVRAERTERGETLNYEGGYIVRENKKNPRVAVYAAFPPEETPKPETFSTFVRNYLHQKGNYMLERIYLDQLDPSTPFGTRPEWQRLVADKMEDVFDVVIIPSLNQLSTSSLDAVGAVRMLAGEPHPIMVDLMYERIYVPDATSDMKLTFHLMIMEEMQQLQSNAKELRGLFEETMEEKQQSATALSNNGE